MSHYFPNFYINFFYYSKMYTHSGITNAASGETLYSMKRAAPQKSLFAGQPGRICANLCRFAAQKAVFLPDFTV